MRYILLLLLIVSCGSRKVQVNNIEEKKIETVASHIVDTTKTITQENLNIKVIDSSEDSEIFISPIDTSKVFIYNGRVVKNAVLRIKKHKNNIITTSSQNSSQIKQNGVAKDVVSKKETQVEIKQKQSERKESLLNYWWILLLIVIGYITYRKYIK
jgi:hypothetical protein